MLQVAYIGVSGKMPMRYYRYRIYRCYILFRSTENVLKTKFTKDGHLFIY